MIAYFTKDMHQRWEYGRPRTIVLPRGRFHATVRYTAISRFTVRHMAIDLTLQCGTSAHGDGPHVTVPHMAIDLTLLCGTRRQTSRYCAAHGDRPHVTVRHMAIDLKLQCVIWRQTLRYSAAHGDRPLATVEHTAIDLTLRQHRERVFVRVREGIGQY